MSAFPFDQPVRLVPVPGTPYVRLEQDENMRRVVAECGTIVCERYIEALPEVRALGPGDLVVDVGAFIGDTALIFASRGAWVVAFEPQLDAYVAAVVNCRYNPRIRVEFAAVGNGERVMPNNDPLAGNSGTRTVRREQHGVETVRLSDYFGEADYRKTAGRVKFIKVDVEGFEPAVIAGARDLIARDRPTLLIEIYPDMLDRQGFAVSDVTRPLLELGYSIREAIGNSTEPRWDVLCTPAPGTVHG